MITLVPSCNVADCSVISHGEPFWGVNPTQVLWVNISGVVPGNLFRSYNRWSKIVKDLFVHVCVQHEVALFNFVT